MKQSKKPAILVLTSNTLYSLTKPEIILSRFLTEYDLAPVFICPKEGSMVEYLRAQGVAVEIVPNIEKWRHLGVRISAGKIIRKILNIASTYDIKLVHAARLSVTPFGVKLAEKLGVPCLSHLHGVPHRADKFERYLTHQADMLVSVSQAALAKHQPKGNNNAVVVYNGMDIKAFRQKAAEFNARPQLALDTQLLAGMVGINSRKGVDIFIKAAAIVAKQLPQARYIIMGQFPSDAEMKTIRKMLEDAGLSEKILFPGYQENVAAFMRIADCWVVTSRDDAAPMVVMEAMALGKPVIGSDIGGIPEMIMDGKSGYIVPREDIEGFAKAMLELLTKPEKRESFGRESLLWAEANCSYERYKQNMWAIYEKLMNKS